MNDIFNIRTDLAVEERERFTERNIEITGVKLTEQMDSEDRVKITIIPPTQDKDGAAEYISCNSYNATAKYGEEMKAPRFVNAIIENQKMALNDLKKTLAKQSK